MHYHLEYASGLFKEHGELTRRVEKLANFIATDKYDELPEIDRKDLKEQLASMYGYLAVLNRRVSRQCNNA